MHACTHAQISHKDWRRHCAKLYFLFRTFSGGTNTEIILVFKTLSYSDVEVPDLFNASNAASLTPLRHERSVVQPDPGHKKWIIEVDFSYQMKQALNLWIRFLLLDSTVLNGCRRMNLLAGWKSGTRHEHWSSGPWFHRHPDFTFCRQAACLCKIVCWQKKFLMFMFCGTMQWNFSIWPCTLS